MNKVDGRFYGDCDTEVAIVLVHGHILGDTDSQIRDLIGEYKATECWCEGGYLLQIAATVDEPLTYQQATDIVGMIYADEDNIPDVSGDIGLPIFTGVQDVPYELLIPSDDAWDVDGSWIPDSLHIYFVAGVHGYEEDGISKYEE